MGIALTRDRYYWSTVRNGPGSVSTINWRSTSTGETQTIVPETDPFMLAIDGSRLYWMTEEMNGEIASLSLDGSALGTVAVDDWQPMDMALDATRVYWVDNFSVKSASKNGGPWTVLFKKTDSHACAVTTASDGVYWSDCVNGVIWKAPYHHPPRVLSSNGPTGSYGQLVADDEYLYWMDSVRGIVRLPRDGGEPVVLASGFPEPAAIAQDCAHIFWTSWETGGGAVYVVDKHGGPTVHLADTYPNNLPQSLAVLGHDIYWTTYDGYVMHMSK